MATADAEKFCNVCEHDHVSKTAVTWCPECEDFLCSNCDRVHAGSKASKQHVVIKVKDYQKLPASILTIKNRCLSHNNKYEFYCTTHGEPCCVICTRNEHRDCKQVCPIHEVTDDAKSSTALEHHERDLEEIDSAFETVKSVITRNISEISQQKANFLTEILKVRKSINDHLDNIEKQVTDELSKIEQKLQVQLQTLLSDIEGKRKQFDNIRQDLKTIKQYASNLQTFISVNEMVATTNENIKKLQGELEYDYYRLEFEIPIGLQSFAENVPSFGIVSVAHTSYQESLITVIKSQVQIPTARSFNSTPKIASTTQVQLLTGRDIVFIRGCDILPDGKLIFADRHGGKLIMCSTDGKYEKDISLPGRPYELKNTHRNEVAVTLPESHKIAFVNITTNACIRTVNTDHCCYGIDTKFQTLLVRAIPAFTPSHVIALSFEGTFISRLYIPGWHSTHISVRDDILMCSDWNKNTVHMYTTAGARLWSFKDEKVLRKPIGISIDKCKNVFVAGNDSHNVVVLSPDGKFCTEFLSERDGLKKPYSLRINIDRDELLVCNRDGQAFRFSLSYDSK